MQAILGFGPPMIKFEVPRTLPLLIIHLKEVPANGALMNRDVEHKNQQLIAVMLIGHIHNTQPVISLYARTETCA